MITKNAKWKVQNVAAVPAVGFTIPNVDPGIVTMVVMWTLWSFILAQIVAPVIGIQAGKTETEGAA
jgi:hypothetical protein